MAERRRLSASKRWELTRRRSSACRRKSKRWSSNRQRVKRPTRRSQCWIANNAARSPRTCHAWVSWRGLSSEWELSLVCRLSSSLFVYLSFSFVYFDQRQREDGDQFASQSQNAGAQMENERREQRGAHLQKLGTNQTLSTARSAGGRTRRREWAGEVNKSKFNFARLFDRLWENVCERIRLQVDAIGEFDSKSAKNAWVASRRVKATAAWRTIRARHANNQPDQTMSNRAVFWLQFVFICSIRRLFTFKQ